MVKVISFINLKGGVGKTTTTVALAEFLASREEQPQVLLIDLDPQTNATIALIEEEYWQELDLTGRTIKQLFKDKLEKTNFFDIQEAIISGVSNLQIENLSLLPSSLGLIDLQDQLALIPGGSFFSTSPVDILKKALMPVMHNYDYILIDCPPNLGIITLNGINISDGFVIPTIPDYLSTYGIPQILNRVEEFASSNSLYINPLGILITKYREQSNLHQSKVFEMRSEASRGELPPIFETVVPEATRIAESVDVDAVFSNIRQKYGYGRNVEVYTRLVEEFVNKCQSI